MCSDSVLLLCVSNKLCNGVFVHSEERRGGRGAEGEGREKQNIG